MGTWKGRIFGERRRRRWRLKVIIIGYRKEPIILFNGFHRETTLISGDVGWRRKKEEESSVRRRMCKTWETKPQR